MSKQNYFARFFQEDVKTNKKIASITNPSNTSKAFNDYFAKANYVRRNTTA